ncbi:hypothetical protein SCAR479_01761 [Seiridium cardinale]|uniref:Glutathione transferase n=1 Tax=Seiridium cardinale TaxID=138064 RepID=A0ABR2Y6I9_9PEZI
MYTPKLAIYHSNVETGLLLEILSTFVQLLETTPVLEAHGVKVDIKPVFLGAINAGSGNKPPWSLPAKAQYAPFDYQRSNKAAGLAYISPPEDLMAASRSVIPLRALHYIKATYPLQTYLTTWHYLLHVFWGPVKSNVSDAAELAKTLSEVPSGFKGPGTAKGSQPLFGKHEVEDILKAANEEKWKGALKTTVEEALERGAFGTPWIWATNSKGEGEPFFGSDRWHFVYEFLGLPHQKVALLPPKEGAKL